MTSFWIAVGISILSAIAYVWNSVDQQMSVAKGLSENRKKSLILPIVFILIAPFAYLSLGNIDKQEKWIEATDKMHNISLGRYSPPKDTDVQKMLLGLRTLIEDDPENGQLWFMLAEGYFNLSFIDLADEAMQRAIRLEPRPEWFVANAQILSVRSNSTDIARSVNLLQNALLVQPEHQSALLTLGFIYLRQQQYDFAVATWQRLLVLLEDSGNDTQTIKRQIEFAKQQQKNNPLEP